MESKIGIAASIFTVIGVIYAAVTFHYGVSYSVSKDTYQYLTAHLADNYPAIEAIIDDEDVTDNEMDRAAKETERFLLEAYSCIEVGACSRNSTLEFVCSTRKLSNALSLSSGMVYAMREMLPALRTLESGNDEGDTSAVHEAVGRFEPHFRVVSIFAALHEGRDDFTPQVPDVPAICDSVVNPGFWTRFRQVFFFG